MEIIFCGDASFKLQHDADEERSGDILSDILPLLRSADFRVVNLECPLAPKELDAPIRKAGPNITGRPENVGFLRAAGFDLAVMANNHAMDFGADAMRYTGALLDNNKIAHIGAGENLMEAYRAHRFEKDGVSVSVISVCEHEFGLAGEDTPGTAAYDEYLLAGAIKNARADSDYVTVVFHGGCEHAPIPSPQCQSRYRSIIMQGADAVVAMHTHCPQGIEICHGKPIFYSLGNFIFKHEPDVPPGWFTGYMVSLRFGAEIGYEIHPYRFDPDGSKIELLRGKERGDMLDYIDRLSAIIADRRELSDYFDGWCVQKSGAEWANGAVKAEYADISSQPENFAGYVDAFTCEAHHDLITSSLRMLFEGRYEKGAVYAGKLRGLQIKSADPLAF